MMKLAAIALPLFAVLQPSSASRLADRGSKNHAPARTLLAFAAPTASAVDAEATVAAKRVDTDDETTKRVAVLLCPAQFCVPADYDTLLSDLESHAENLGARRVAPLPRTEWIKVARQLPTRAFVDARLPVRETLGWYFDAMEAALSEIFAEEGDDVNLCIVGHSIGGWVARAYLGGLSGSSTAVFRLTQERCTSFITLGTPHSSPEGALVDQTRGLLRQVESTAACSSQSLSERGIELTCVGSSSLPGKLITTDVEELVAATSYLPLLGQLGGVRGDGIVPTDLAFMDTPARRVEVEKCGISGVPVRHAHVLPTPWNLIDGSAPSIALPDDFAWYGSPGVVGQWASYIK